MAMTAHVSLVVLPSNEALAQVLTCAVQTVQQLSDVADALGEGEGQLATLLHELAQAFAAETLAVVGQWPS